MTSIYYIDGEYVYATDAQIPADDLSVLRGFGVFDYMRTYGGKPFRLSAHLARLERSAQLVGLDLPHSLSEIEAITLETLRRNNYNEAGIRLVLTGGTSPDNIMPQSHAARLIVMVTPFTPPGAEMYTQGVKVITNHAQRYLPGAKTIDYTAAIVALRRAASVGAIDALYIDAQGNALEGTTMNLFAFLGDRLVTPGENVLLGITRQAVLELAAPHFDVAVTALPLSALLQADEVFLTSSNKEVCPVVQIDDTVIGDGRPGANTTRLITLFREMRDAYA